VRGDSLSLAGNESEKRHKQPNSISRKKILTDIDSDWRGYKKIV